MDEERNKPCFFLRAPDGDVGVELGLGEAVGGSSYSSNSNESACVPVKDLLRPSTF
eukprot:CAMPEP_0171813682 /NCGR_PEP_ID=MMETSP0991-20121206/79345_1 /TAXON_ID=483369 /ORGANISM="non described non described, Strain CCMP2098" /LENGTH=55 /DNA_ID=CAMNT_0012427279 /DNA_START=16 /DNA_END=183 /DNA_ORIENTATION=-